VAPRLPGRGFAGSRSPPWGCGPALARAVRHRFGSRESGAALGYDRVLPWRAAVSTEATRRGVAQSGSALDWGSRGPGFESRLPDHAPPSGSVGTRWRPFGFRFAGHGKAVGRSSKMRVSRGLQRSPARCLRRAHRRARPGRRDRVWRRPAGLHQVCCVMPPQAPLELALGRPARRLPATGGR
jgi:hypothetical protein